MANTYPTTQFPLGSTEVKVLFNNASNFDDVMNSELPSFYDRFNKRRETWAGMQKMVADFLEAMGFEATHLIYVDGTPLTVLRPTQLIDRAGSVYKVKMPATFPVNLTGTWATDQLLLVDVGDSSLRSDISNFANPALGAGMIGRGGQVVGSLTELRGLLKTSVSTQAFVTAYDSARPGYGGGSYRLDAADGSSAESVPLIIVATDGGRWKLIHDGVLSIDQFGCAPISGYNNFTPLQAAIEYGYNNDISIYAGSGTYEYGTTLDLGYPQLVMRGAGFRNTVFKFTGTGRAMDSLGGRPNNGAYSFDIDLSDFTIEGNANTTDLFRCRLNHPRLRDINVREASTINGCGFRLEGPVLGYFQNLTMSTNTQLMTSRPLVGLVVDADPTDGRRATANTFVNLIVEGAFGDGVRFIACDAAAVLGGSSENNGGTGITLLSGCQMNSLMGFDCESNLGYADVYESGSFNKFINCGTHKKLYVDNSSVSSSFEGGWHNEIEVGSGAAYPEFSRLKVRFFGGATAITLNGNQSASFKQIFDVQLAQFIYPAKPVTTLTVPLGGFTYTNNNLFAVSVAIIGGTIGTLQMNRGVVAGVTALPLTGVFWLEPGDGLTFGGVSVAPTAKIIPHGANLV